MARISVDVDALAAAAGMGKVTETTVAKAHAVTKTFTAMLQRSVVSKASGRPGPNAPTGHYRRTINRLTTLHGHQATGVVGSSAGQARRLELGFVGQDSLGRSYDQPAYPHFGPALDEIAPGFEAALGEVVANIEETA